MKSLTELCIVAGCFFLIASVIIALIIRFDLRDLFNPYLFNRFRNRGVLIGAYTYRDMVINYNCYGRKEFIVDYSGAEWEFRTMKAATDFIDAASDRKPEKVINFQNMKLESENAG